MLQPFVSSFSFTSQHWPCFFSISVTHPEGGDFLNIRKEKDLCIAEVEWFAIFKSVIASSRLWFLQKTLRAIQNSISIHTDYNYFRSLTGLRSEKCSRNFTSAECSCMSVYSSSCCMKNGHTEPFGIFLSTGDLCDVTFNDSHTEMVDLQLTFNKKK